MAESAGTRNAKRAKDDMVKESQAAVKGPESAKAWITDNELVIKGECITIGTLTTALYHLCSGKFTQPKEMINGIWAIAICLEELNQMRYTSEALDTVKEQVEEVVKGAKEAIEGLVEEMKSAIKETEDANKPSYAQALANGSDSRTESRDRQIKNDVKIRGQLQRRQIILDGDDATKDQTSQLTPKVLITKANLALDKLEKDIEATLQEDNNERPEDTKFVAARILKNGGVLFEMSNENAAEWLKQKEISKAFESCFPGAVSIKGRTYQVVVQFLPVRLKNRLEELYTEIEKENELPKDSIASLKWLRNLDNWGANQTKAHVILTLNSRRVANDIIMGGILVDGSRHDARKLEEDPKRCFKCQLIGAGHTAANCKADEACSNCAGKHSTGECRASQPEFRCATCKKDGRQDDHAAWDRQCPAFIEEKARLRDKKPENHYRFFPAEYEDWTWVRNEDSLADGYTDRWMGNDSRRGPKQPQDTRRDDGWGRPLELRERPTTGRRE